MDMLGLMDETKTLLTLPPVFQATTIDESDLSLCH